MGYRWGELTENKDSGNESDNNSGDKVIRSYGHDKVIRSGDKSGKDSGNKSGNTSSSKRGNYFIAFWLI